MAKAKITRIKAGEASAKTEKAEKAEKVTKVVKAEKTEKATKIAKTKETKPAKAEKKPFILFRPFVAFFRYLRDSWREIRQVRWPNRKTTWKMVLAVVVYTALFVIIISLLDLFFTWLFNLILGN